MIIDGISYREFAEKVRSESKYEIILPFVELMERKLGAKVIFDLQNIPFGRYDLADPLQIAYRFKKEGILEWFGYVDPLPDEPPFRLWKGSQGKESGKRVGGGSLTDDRAALFAVFVAHATGLLCKTGTYHECRNSAQRRVHRST